VVEVLRFPYESKKGVEDRLKLTAIDIAQPYFVDAPESGYCLSYKVQALERVHLPKPDGFRFPQTGWLRVDEDVLQEWPELAPVA
jgi:hypothetical protein